MVTRRSKKVEVFLVGGLGNQLFGWATGFSLAKRFDCELILNTSQLGKRNLAIPAHLHQTAKISEINPFYYRINSKLFRRFYRNIPLVRSYFEKDFNFENRFLYLKSPTKLHGYFQSVKYFEENLNEVIYLINKKENLSNEYFYVRESLPDDFVALHFRRGDYLQNQDYHPIATMEYYEKALIYLESKNLNNIIVVFTDDEVLAKVAFPDEIIIAESKLKSPFDNLYLMSKAQAIIGANSSFSLWAGLLIGSRDGICIFPQKWFGSPEMRDLSPVPPNFLTF